MVKKEPKEFNSDIIRKILNKIEEGVKFTSVDIAKLLPAIRKGYITAELIYLNKKKYLLKVSSASHGAPNVYQRLKIIKLTARGKGDDEGYGREKLGVVDRKFAKPPKFILESYWCLMQANNLNREMGVGE